MTTLTIKNIPDNLYKALKQQAKQQHRSLNSHVIFYLEQSLLNKKINADAWLKDVQKLRKSTSKLSLDDKLLNKTKKRGRL